MQAIGAPSARDPAGPFAAKVRGPPGVVWHHGRVTIPLPQREPDPDQYAFDQRYLSHIPLLKFH